jgi:hypothetical protein
VRGGAVCAAVSQDRVNNNNNLEITVQNVVQVVGGSNPLAPTKEIRKKGA